MLNISAVERETGLSKDVLRTRARRFGFPKPGRDDNGERQYTPADIAKLRAIKRLMDMGMRPGKLMARSLDELNVLANMLMRQGLQKFVLESITPLNRAVGEAWMRGELQVFEEHLYTERLQVAMRTAINAFPRQTGIPRVLLTTFPNEQHGIGLLMVKALPQCAPALSLRGHRRRVRRRCGRPPMPSTIPPPIRRSHPSRPSSSTSTSVGSRHRRSSPVCDAGQARACPRQPARARPPWRRRRRERATTSARSSPLPPNMVA